MEILTYLFWFTYLANFNQMNPLPLFKLLDVSMFDV